MKISGLWNYSETIETQPLFTEALPFFTPKYSDLFNAFYRKIRVEFNQYAEVSGAYISNAGSVEKTEKKDNKCNRISESASYNSLTHSKWADYIKEVKKYINRSYFSLAAGILITLLILYYFIKFSTYRIYGLDFKSYADNLVPRQRLGYVAERLKILFKENSGSANSFNNTMLIGVNASHIFEIRNSFKSWEEIEFYCLDFLELQNLNIDFETVKLDNPTLSLFFKEKNEKRINDLVSILDEKSSDHGKWVMIFIEHFEFGYNDLFFNKIKLRILKRFVDNPNIRVIISSEISPAKIYDFYEGSIRRLEKSIKKGDEKLLEKRKEIAIYKIDYKMWLHLLGGFYRLTIPFEYNNKFHSNNKLLKEELDHGRYLYKINEAFKKGPLEKDIPPEHQILLIQEIAYSYYFSIWNSLTKEERYTVFDIAKDKFVNTNNVDGIIDLLHKGVLVYDHSLRLMNESFTNFVLSKVDSDEALARELEQRKGGSWSTTSSVLFLVVISLIVFISFGEVSFLNDINALIGSIAAVFTLILRIGGIFTFGKSSG
ncbi:hypothetical protein [Mangrovivirga cuniculi]|uniref:Uncharacterized protein n=1 Tax=Mangrovivirga cuniculi TaxID=2715131 RepID=A0A4D7JNU4_9BACT|nr:hypothetical protein [Mangrovivirga cuniculi]QCK15170.1 hypothetical protein DCC35_10635 [Mangrovivirga cuniculi]